MPLPLPRGGCDLLSGWNRLAAPLRAWLAAHASPQHTLCHHGTTDTTDVTSLRFCPVAVKTARSFSIRAPRVTTAPPAPRCCFSICSVDSSAVSLKRSLLLTRCTRSGHTRGFTCWKPLRECRTFVRGSAAFQKKCVSSPRVPTQQPSRAFYIFTNPSAGGGAATISRFTSRRRAASRF